MRDKSILLKREKLLIGMFVFLLIVTLSVTSNTIAKKNNGGKMPVLTSSSYKTNTHFTFQEKQEVSHFYLTDIISLGGDIYSIGDFGLYLGFIGVTLFSILWIVQIRRDSNAYRKVREINKK